MTEKINLCGIKKCEYQIPYDMAEHDRIIYQQGRADVIKELEQYRFGKRGGLIHWEDVEKIKEQTNE